MRRIATVVAALLLPMQAQALGVGEIESYSALNQPLEAEIGLFSVGSINQNEIRVKLAPFEAYEQAGIEYPSILSSLKFSVEERPDGEYFIRAHSTESVQDPFLDILLAIDWPNGHLMREYTVLLDLPVMTDEKVGSVTAPVTSVEIEPAMPSMVEGSAYVGSGSVKTPTDTTPAPVNTMTTAEPVYAETGRSMGSGDLRVGMVKRGDTLWGIAESMRTDRTVSVQQIMIALLKNNPQAFYNNNINNLKAGYVLRLDDPSLITAMSQDEASREAQRQYQAWRAGKNGRGSAAADADQSGQAVSGAGAAAGAASLRLISPDDADSILSKAASGESDIGSLSSENLDALRQELNYALNSSDTSRQENSELRARIAELEEQIGKMQRLLSLRDDALSVLQSSTSEDDGAASTAVAADDAAQTAAEPIQDAKKAGTAEIAANKAQETTPPAQVKPKAAAPKKTQAAEESLVDTVMGYINRTVNLVSSAVSPVVLGGAVGGLLLLLGGAWFLRKRKITDDDLEQSMRVEVADQKLSEDLANGTVTDLSEPTEETSAVELLDSTEADKYEADIDEIDVMAEADVYLAYQRFDRAEELMREAIENEPDRLDLKMKLLEVLSVSANTDGFVEVAEQYVAKGGKSDSAQWAKVCEMAAGIGIDEPLFSGSQAGGQISHNDVELPGGDLDADLGSLDDDLMASLDEDIATVNAGEEDAAVSEDQTADQPGEIEIESSLDDGLDFDLSEHTEATDANEGEMDDLSALVDADDENEQPVADLEALDGTLDETRDEPVDVSGLDETGNELEFDTTDLTTEDSVSGEFAAEESTSEETTSDKFNSNESADAAIDADEGLTFVSSSMDDGVIATEDDETESAVSDTKDTTIDNALEFDLGDLATESVSESDTPANTEDSDDTLTASASDELDELDSNAMAFDSDEVDMADIDDDLAGDIDWLTSAADDAAEDDSESDSFFSSEDEVATKLDLIHAYIDMGDTDSARNILAEVVEEGNDEQKNEAQEILKQIG